MRIVVTVMTFIASSTALGDVVQVAEMKTTASQFEPPVIVGFNLNGVNGTSVVTPGRGKFLLFYASGNNIYMVKSSGCNTVK